MDIQKEREAFQNFCEQNFDVERHEQTYFDEQTQSYENDLGECTESINMAWMAWQAKAQAVPEGFVLMPKEPTKDTLIEIASVCIGDDFANLDEAKELYKAAIKAQESAND